MANTLKYDLDTDTTLGGNSASDYVTPSQKAIKSYVDNHSGGSGVTDVKVNNASVVSGGVANIVTNSAYNASSNKIATMSDIPSTSNFVTKTTDQIITSIKTFRNETSGSAINGGLLFDYNTTQGGVVAQQSDGLLVSGYQSKLKLAGTDITVQTDNGTARTLVDPATGIIPDARLSSNVEFNSNKVTSISSSSTDTQYPSAKSVVELLKTIYPVGAIFIGTTATCPMSALFGTWELVSSGKALWTGNGANGNTTISAGLPNITAEEFSVASYGTVYNKTDQYGAMTRRFETAANSKGSSNGSRVLLSFDASNSNSIYGNSTTVQPPAYVVNVWRRTA